MTLAAPLIVWGSVDALSGWTASATVTATQADPFGGTAAYKVDDASGAAQLNITKNVTLLRDGTALVTWFLKGGTSALSILGLYDTTAATVRHQVNVTWTAGVPSLSTRNGAGTLFTPISVGSSYYLIRFTATGCLAANTNTLQLYPANAAADTGYVYAYRQSAVIVPALDVVMRRRDRQPGSEVIEAPSGVQDAWTVAPSATVSSGYTLRAGLRWIPEQATDSPIASGWDGAAEYIGVNQGFDAMLRAGQDKNLLRWVPDRSACSTYLDSYLMAPMEGGGQLEAGGTPLHFAIPDFTLKNVTRPYAGYLA